MLTVVWGVFQTAASSSASWISSVLPYKKKKSIDQSVNNLPFYKTRSLSHRSEDLRDNNLAAAQRLCPGLKHNDFILSCDANQSGKFHGLFANVLFNGQDYASVKSAMDNIAHRCCDKLPAKGSLDDLMDWLSSYQAETLGALLFAAAGNNDETKAIRRECTALFIEIGRFFIPGKPGRLDIRQSIKRCYDLMVKTEGTLAYQMLQKGYTEESIKITHADLVKTGFDTHLTLLMTVIWSLARSPNHQRNVSTDGDLLERVLIESLRINPPVSDFGAAKMRVADLAASPEITGYTHKNPNVFDPDAITSVPKRPRDIPFLPYGYGPTKCPFASYAMDAAKALTTAFFNEHHLQMDDQRRTYLRTISRP